MTPKPFEPINNDNAMNAAYEGYSNGSQISETVDDRQQSGQLFFVSTYTDFERLAHGPRGMEVKNSLYVYRLFPSDGSMVLLNIDGDKEAVVNPAFSRFHPRLNVVYTCTEDIENNGQIFAYAIDADGGLKKMGQVDAGGTSTCYLTIDKAQKHLLAVNYWDSTLAVIPINHETGEFAGPISSMYDPKHGQKVVSALKKNGGCNHSHNDDSTIKERQKDPHSHALVLDPFVGCVAYVPDLGKDLVREFLYDKDKGAILHELNTLPSGLCTGKPDGPRYFEFHPHFPVAYVVNELSSTVAVFAVDKHLLREIAIAAKNNNPMDKFLHRSTIRLIQSISTIPSAFPRKMNTCGRVCVHMSGHFVIVSNRGHESIAIFRVVQKGPKRGHLRQIGFFHTRGETPRHFQFDSSGQYLIVANQDSNTIAVFSFNLSSGEIRYTGNEYRVPSPNFVCSCPIYDDESDKYFDKDDASLASSISNASTLIDESTIVTENNNLELQLKMAKAEIEDLKRKLCSMSSDDTSVPAVVAHHKTLGRNISTLTEE